MAWARQHRSCIVDLPAGSTVAQAVAAADLPGAAEVSGYAIFGVGASPSTVLRHGDRIELLRPLQADPKDARRRRASAGRTL